MGKIACIGFTCLLMLGFLMRLFYVRDPYYIYALLLALCVAVCWWRKPVQLTSIDICLLGLWACFGLLPSVNVVETVDAYFCFTSGLLAYFLVRCLLIQGGKWASYLLASLTVCIVVVSVLALSLFIIFSNRVREAGFTSLYDFRSLYQPLGVPLNEWNALQWLFGGILAAAYRECTDKRVKGLAVLAGGMVLCQSWLSFSRGMYLAGALFVVCRLMIEGKRLFERRRMWIGCLYGVLVVGMCALYPAETLRVVRGNETLSQRRSADSRMKEVDIAKAVLDEYPFGVGFGNYTLARDYFQHGEERVDVYTSYAMNVFSKVAVEGGYVGLFAWMLLLGSMLAYLIRKRNREAWVLFLFLMAFFIREQTFSTLFDSRIVQLSAWVLLALLQKKEVPVSSGGRYVRWVAVCPCLVWAGLFIAIQWVDKSEKSVPKLVNRALACKDTDRQLALSLLGQAGRQSPLDVQLVFYQCAWHGQAEFPVEEKEVVKKLAENYPDKLLFRWNLYEWHKRCGQMEEAQMALTEAILQSPRILETSFWQALQKEEHEFAGSVEEKLKEVIKKKPDEVIRLAKYGGVALQLGQAELAEAYLAEANRRLPNLSQVWFNLASIRERQGRREEAELYRRKGRLIERGVLSKDETYVPASVKEVGNFLYRSYPLLFNIWYRSQLLQDMEPQA